MSQLLVAQRALTVPGWAKDALWRRAQAIPSLDLRFADSKSLVDATTGSNLVTFTRASSGTFVGSDGVIRTAVTNLQTFSEQFDNAAWTKGGLLAFGSGSTADAIAAPNGALTADKIVEDTSTGYHRIFAGPSGLVAGNAYTGSIFVKAAERTEVSIEFRASSTLGGYVINLSTGAVVSGSPSGQTIQVVNAGDGWWRICITQSSATSTSGSGLILAAMRSGGNTSYTGDGTSGIYLWGAQLEQSSTVGEYIPTTSTINSAPRFDHNPTTGESLGLLVEEQRTNSIRNNTMVGAVAGTPGTLPTNWFVGGSGLGTLTQQVVGTGSIGSLSYIDIKLSGTTSTTGLIIFHEQNTQVPASSGQTWTASAYTAVVAGSTSNVTGLNVLISERNSSGGFVTQQSFSANTGASLIRAANTRTLNGATTAYVNTGIELTFNSGGAIDITLRIGLPQLEQGAFATSVIPTSTVAVTRSADVASISGSNFSAWYRQDEGTFFGDAQTPFAVTGFPVIAAGRVSSTDIVQIGFVTESLSVGYVKAANADQAVMYNTGLSGVRRRRVACGMAVDSFAVSTNGGSLVTDSSGSMPTNIASIFIGSTNGSSAVLNGTIRRLVFWGQRLPNNILQSITQ